MANNMINSVPTKMWINGKVFPIQKLSRFLKKSNNKKPKLDVEAQGELLEGIEEDGKGCRFTIKVPKTYYSKLKTMPQLDLQQLCDETETEIHIPTMDHEHEITVSGKCSKKLSKAVGHLHWALAELRCRIPPLHFTCIPCTHPTIQESFLNLKKEILSMEDNIEGMHESIFMNHLKLHVTIDVYSLLDEHERAEAVRGLNEYMLKGPLTLDIGSLECMTGNWKKANVVYANVKLVDGDLQKIVNDIAEHFYHRGLARRYPENVKLHMTVINTKYRKCDIAGKKRWRQSIDATGIRDKFKDYHFGQCHFDSVHLSEMTLQSENGFYKPLAVIKLLDCEENNNKL